MDFTGVLLVVALAPAVFWLYYFYSRDRYEPEPLGCIIRVYLLGIAVTIPVALLEGSLEILAGGFLTAVIIAPVFEEYAKYLVVRKSVYPTLEFSEPLDGIIYAAAAGLGFATLENVIYVFSALEGSFLLAVQTGVVRGLISVPGHVLFSAMWGYALGQARFVPPGKGNLLIIRGLLAAIGAHALFNLLLFSYAGFAILVLVLVPLLWIMVRNRIHTTLADSLARTRGRR